jgi:hypothetical protein
MSDDAFGGLIGGFIIAAIIFLGIILNWRQGEIEPAEYEALSYMKAAYSHVPEIRDVFKSYGPRIEEAQMASIMAAIDDYNSQKFLKEEN